jgi:hypothetical protein
MRRALTIVSIFAAACAAWIAITGGGRFPLFGLTITATDPYRPLAAAVLALAVRMFFGPRTVLQDFRDIRSVFTPASLCAVFVASVVVLGGLAGSNIAGGADSYGYISQADLWLKGNLVTPQPAAARVPWPDGQWTFSPLGYRPSPSREAIVPQYSPGFPLLLAGVKLAGGQCAIGGVVPVMAGLLVALTFLVGRRIASDEIALAAAWLMATSPVFLYMLMSPMSDIPAAAFWGLAAYGCLAGSRTGAVLGGIAAALAVLIRPNLAHVGFVMALWMAVRDIRSSKHYTALARPAGFLVPVIIASIAVAWLNDNLYGAATNSGYGSLASIFRTGFFARNLINYTSWLAESQTPIALIGLAAICVPLSRLIGSRADMRDKGLLAAMSVSVIATYLFYMNFDTWWYLRFLLPMWMAVCIGTAYVLTGRSGRSFNTAGKAVVFALGIYGMWFAQKEGVLDLGRNEQRYVKIAQLVRDTTERNAVVITLQHSGSIRYYGGRTTLRYEVLHDRWLDRTISWLQTNGFHPYILLDSPEHEPFRRKFARNAASNLDIAIVFEYRDRYNTSTYLYDPLQPSKLSSVPILVAAPRREMLRDCAPPAREPAVFSMEHALR